MKCEHCGKNEATFYYRSSINGSVTEQHLCDQCAASLGYTDSLEKHFAQMEKSLFAPFADFFTPVPVIASRTPAAERMLQCAKGEETRSRFAGEFAREHENDLVSEEEHCALKRQRRLNVLRHEMQQAIQEENFEKAAELRDQIRAMEQSA